MPISLEDIRIASPCSMDWDAMTGDDRARVCSQCKLTVYNIREMSQYEAEAMISKASGEVCVRMYKRSDGTVVTSDCPIGKARVRNQVFAMSIAVGAFAVMLIGSMVALANGRSPRANGGFFSWSRWYREDENSVLMGAVCMPEEPVREVPFPESPNSPSSETL